MRRFGLLMVACLGLGALCWVLVARSGRDSPVSPGVPEEQGGPAEAAESPAPPDAAGGRRAPRAALTVVVVDAETGAPLSGARLVRLASDGMIARTDNVLAEWAANEHGAAELNPEPGEEWVLAATAPEHIWAPHRRVTAHPGQPSVLTLQVPRGVPVEGKLVDAKGEAIAGVRVEARNETYLEPADFNRVSGDSWGAVDSDEKGAFRLWLRPGSAQLAAGSGPWRVEVQEVEVPGGPWTIVLRQAAALRGRVFDAAGRPVGAGVEVGFASGDPTRTDARGQYALDSLEPVEGELDCVLDRPSGNELSREKVTPEAGRWLEHDVHLESAGVITGGVVDGNGKGVADARVVALEIAAPVEGEPWVDGRGLAPEFTLEDRYGAAGERLRARTGPDGRFALSTHHRHGEGWYLLRAFTGSAADDPAAAKPCRAGADVSLTLREEPVVRGRVNSSEGPLAKFSIFGLEFKESFELSREAVGARFRIDAAGFQSRRVELANRPPGSVELGTITLSATHDVVLEAWDAVTGERLVDLLSDLDGEAEPISTVDARGRLLLVGVPLPTARVWIGSRAYLPAAVELGPTTDVVTLRLTRGASLGLTSDEPLSGGVAEVSCEPPLPLLPIRRAPFVGKRAVVTGFPAARCTWSVNSPQGSATSTVEFSADARAEASVHLAPNPPSAPGKGQLPGKR